MTVTPETATREALRAGFIESLAVYLKPRVLIVILLGFSSGLPLALSGSTLAVWMVERGVDLKTIGLFSLVGLPYTIKFLWAPLVDALDVPLLSRRLGRRRGWLVFSQLLLGAAIVFLGVQDPVGSPWMVALGAVLVATASATQDIVIDAFRVESLDTSEQAAGMAGYVAAYRIGMLASGAGVLVLVAWFEHIGVGASAVWMWGYAAAAALMVVGLASTLLAREPAVPERPRQEGNPATRVLATAFGAFQEFLTRDAAIAILLMVVLYKFCDAFAGVLDRALRHRDRLRQGDLCSGGERRRPCRLADRRICGRSDRVARCRCRRACGSAPSCRCFRIWRSPGSRSWAPAFRRSRRPSWSRISAVRSAP